MTSSFAIGGAIIPHKDINKRILNFPDGHAVNQIDYIIIDKKYSVSKLRKERSWLVSHLKQSRLLGEAKLAPS